MRRRADALAELNRLVDQAGAGGKVSHYALAAVHSAVGNKEEAFAELESAYEERAWSMLLLRHEPAFDNLRSDPRFTRLIRKVSSL